MRLGARRRRPAHPRWPRPPKLGPSPSPRAPRRSRSRTLPPRRRRSPAARLPAGQAPGSSSPPWVWRWSPSWSPLSRAPARRVGWRANALRAPCRWKANIAKCTVRDSRGMAAAKRILVVDDQESMRQMLSDLLELMGHETRGVEGGGSALQNLRAQGADLVITDLNMPVMNGMELMKQIKSEFPGTPVIIITGYGSFHTEKQVLSNGADGYIPKPCTIHRVQQTVNQALGVT